MLWGDRRIYLFVAYVLYPSNFFFFQPGFILFSAIMCYVVGRDEEIQRKIVDRSSCYKAHCLPLHSTLKVLISVGPENGFLNSEQELYFLVKGPVEHRQESPEGQADVPGE